MVEERLAAGGADAVNLAALIAESLVDVILRVPGHEQAKLLAHTIAALGDAAETRKPEVGKIGEWNVARTVMPRYWKLKPSLPSFPTRY